jgi:LysM repeat protein
MSWFDKYSEREEFFFNVDSLKKIPPPPPVVNNTTPNSVKQNPSNAATKVAVKTPAKTVTVPNASTAGRVKYVHKITTGESLYSIAKKYNVTISQLKSWNNLHSDLINAGKTLNVWVIRR